MLLSAVFRDKNYWVFNSKSLHTDSGDFDYDQNHIDQAWQVIRYHNQKSHKLVSAGDIQHKNYSQKRFDESVKLCVGDIVKFGRVRFRIKELVCKRPKLGEVYDETIDHQVKIDLQEEAPQRLENEYIGLRETSANLERYFTQDDRESRPNDNFIPEERPL